MSISVLPESQLPGVYVKVFPEGLIAVAPAVQNIIAIVGTARQAPLLTAIPVGSFTQARSTFGDLDESLTLIKAMELAFDNGATFVYGIRVGPAYSATITYTGSSSASNVLQLTAISPGNWGNSIESTVQYASTTNSFLGDGINSAFTLTNTPTGSLNSYTYPYVNASVDGSSVIVETLSGSTIYISGSAPAVNSTVLVNYNYTSATQLTLSVTGSTLWGVGYRTENYNNILSANDIVSRLNAVITGSTLVSGSVLVGGTPQIAVSTGSNLSGGNDGASAVVGDYLNGLDVCDTIQQINIVNLAGQDDPALHASLEADVDNMSNDLNQGNRIGIVGGSLGETDDQIFARLSLLDDYRMVFVHPGLQIISRQTSQPVYRSGAYMASAVSGELSSLPVHYSLTNKTLTGMFNLERIITPVVQQNYLTNRIAVEIINNGIRILEGITTSSNPAWQQLTTVRIVDSAIETVRANAQPYIGNLNNATIRAAMKASIDAGLTDMYNAGMFVSWVANGVFYPGFSTTVYASREDEIQGICHVTLVLQPVFSISFIEVSIFLQ